VTAQESVLHRRLREAAVTAACLAATLPCLVALISAFVSPSTTWTVRVTLAAFCVLAVSRPAAALLAATALLGFGVTLAYMAEAPLLRVTEVSVLAALAGVGLQAAIPGSRVREGLRQQVSAPVVLLALAAVASAVVWQRVYQMGVGDPPAYFESLFRVLPGEYLFHMGDFRPLVTMAMLLEGLALYVAVAALCRVDETFFPRSLRMLVAGGAGLGLLSVVRFAEILLRNPEGLAVMRASAAGLRISPQISDYIAAGSYFSLCWLVSVGLALAAPRRRVLWLAAGVPLLAALYLTGSRSVIAAALAGLGILAVVVARQWTLAIGRVLAFGAVIVMAMVISYPWMTGRDIIGETAKISLMTRWELARTTVRVIETRPLFGVGFNRHHALADSLGSAELNAMWQGAKNPHNDFLRVGAELGLIGMGLLVWIVGAAGLRIWRGISSTGDVRLAGLGGGLLAFLTTSMVSDPLSFREVSYAFWIALGLAVGYSAAGSGSRELSATGAARPPGRGWRSTRRAAPLLLAGLLVASIPARARQELRGSGIEHVSYGFYEWGADDSGTPNRWSGPRGTFFVDGRASAVEVPLSGSTPRGVRQQVEIHVDGRLANRVSVGSEWQRVLVTFPGEPSPDARRIDLVVSPTWVPAELIGNEDRRVLGVRVGLIKTIRPSDGRR
jgi:O-antigen ligase